MENDVQGYDWHPGWSVDLTIDDPGNGTGVDLSDTKTVDPSGTVVFGDLGSLTLAQGMIITMTHGAITKSLTVSDLIVDGVDPVEDTVWGRGTDGAELNVQYCDESGCSWRRFVTVQPDNSWLADFSEVGGPTPEEQNILNIVPGMRGEAPQSDEDSDITDYQWYVPNPTLASRFPENEVHGDDWPLGASVTLNIDDPHNGVGVDYTETKTVIAAPWDTKKTWVQFILESFALEPEQLITMSDGATTKQHTISHLAIGDYDVALDTIEGTVEPDREVQIYADCSPAGCAAFRRETANGGGGWSADFSEVGEDPDEQGLANLNWGTNGQAITPDADGDSTIVQWHLPELHLAARFPENEVHGYDWPTGSSVTLQIDDPYNGPGVDYTDTQTVVVAPWNPSQGWVQFTLGSFVLQPGHLVSMTMGTTVKQHTIRSLAITGVGVATDTISGTVEPGSELNIDANCDPSGCSAFRRETANGAGAWSADFSTLGGDPDEQDLADIQTSSHGEARALDSDGDFTARQWDADVPSLIAPWHAEALLSRRPILDWSDVGGATKYSLQISRDSGFTSLVTNTLITPSIYAPAVDMSANTMLYWRVRAKFGSVYGGWSEVRRFTTANPPSIPVLSAPANNSLLLDYTPLLDWNDSTLPIGTTFDHYQVQLATDAAFMAALDRSTTIGDKTDSKYTIPDPDSLTPNTNYYWRVRSYNADGEYSAWSASRTFRTVILPPTLTAPPNGPTVGSRRPIFDWGDVPGATKYKVQISKSSIFSGMLLQATVISSTFTPTKDLPAATTLYWRVEALGTNGPSAWSSPTWRFTTP